MKSSSRTRRPPILETHFVLKNTTFRTPAISQNYTKCCTCHEKPHSNFTKYCACHAKRISKLIRLTCEASFTLCGATRVTLQLHQILRLPRKMHGMSSGIRATYVGILALGLVAATTAVGVRTILFATFRRLALALATRVIVASSCLLVGHLL